MSRKDLQNFTLSLCFFFFPKSSQNTEKPKIASTNTVPPKLPYQLGFGRQASFPRGHKPHVQLLTNQSHHLSFWWQHWEPWLLLPRQLAGLQQKSCATAAPGWPPPSCSQLQRGLRLLLSSIWRSSWTQHAEGKKCQWGKNKNLSTK